jgi:dimethylamine monooxygenase subunit A
MGSGALRREADQCPLTLSAALLTAPLAPRRRTCDTGLMRQLTPETLHLPFEPGPYRMSMSLVTLPESAWFELDDRYPDEMRERTRLLAEQHPDVFAALPVSDAARSEALEAIADNLATHHPDWFVRHRNALHNHLTGEDWDLASTQPDALECAGRLVQEDLCIIQLKDDIPILTAAVLCFPSRWRLAEKLGRPLANVHAPVPFYAERLARPVDRFMRHVKPGHIAARLNWSVMDDPTLFQPGGKWREAYNPAVTATNAGETLFVRVERQTLRRLPRSDAVLFGIRVHVYKLASTATSAATAALLAEAVRALPEETMRYKSLLPIRKALLAWLDSLVEGVGFEPT